MLCKGFSHLGLMLVHDSIGKLHEQLLHPIKIGRSFKISIALANSSSVLLNLSETPFCNGEYGAEVSIIIPFFSCQFPEFFLDKFLSIVKT